LPLADDGLKHRLRVRLGQSALSLSSSQASSTFARSPRTEPRWTRRTGPPIPWQICVRRRSLIVEYIAGKRAAQGRSRGSGLCAALSSLLSHAKICAELMDHCAKAGKPPDPGPSSGRVMRPPKQLSHSSSGFLSSDPGADRTVLWDPVPVAANRCAAASEGLTTSITPFESKKSFVESKRWHARTDGTSCLSGWSS